MNIVGDSEHFKQPYDNDDDYISKTSYKKESADLQEAGLKLVNLSKSQLEKLELSEELYDALMAIKKIKPKTEAYRRQVQFIGKVMRNEDVEQLEVHLANLLNKNNNEAAKIQIFEKLRDKLLSDGDAEIQLLLEEHPHLDRQKLRQLVRSGNKELAKGPESKSATELFKYLRSEIE
ncbi:ribosome-associated protein [Shewanella corallii]|uniref:Dual-action ribosomal maturation protein DarP n=1 Tax=Shewanella corallii TaxID=560080 RepID=A0ABT0N1I3_9GAMM|nr:ribosome biogenesis factor YjgA [Shewanella corallii]MCL2912284.1 ribosome-associated protein [Shewanella corallii]